MLVLTNKQNGTETIETPVFNLSGRNCKCLANKCMLSVVKQWTRLVFLRQPLHEFQISHYVKSVATQEYNCWALVSMQVWHSCLETKYTSNTTKTLQVLHIWLLPKGFIRWDWIASKEQQSSPWWCVQRWHFEQCIDLRGAVCCLDGPMEEFSQFYGESSVRVSYFSRFLPSTMVVFPETTTEFTPEEMSQSWMWRIVFQP